MKGLRKLFELCGLEKLLHLLKEKKNMTRFLHTGKDEREVRNENEKCRAGIFYFIPSCPSAVPSNTAVPSSATCHRYLAYASSFFTASISDVDFTEKNLFYARGFVNNTYSYITP